MLRVAALSFTFFAAAVWTAAAHGREGRGRATEATS